MLTYWLCEQKLRKTLTMVKYELPILFLLNNFLMKIQCKHLFSDCDDYHYGFNCEKQCFCEHGVCNNIKGKKENSSKCHYTCMHMCKRTVYHHTNNYLSNSMHDQVNNC